MIGKGVVGGWQEKPSVTYLVAVVGGGIHALLRSRGSGGLGRGAGNERGGSTEEDDEDVLHLGGGVYGIK